MLRNLLNILQPSKIDTLLISTFAKVVCVNPTTEAKFKVDKTSYKNRNSMTFDLNDFLKTRAGKTVLWIFVIVVIIIILYAACHQQIKNIWGLEFYKQEKEDTSKQKNDTTNFIQNNQQNNIKINKMNGDIIKDSAIKNVYYYDLKNKERK